MKTLAQLKAICQYSGWQDNTTTGLVQLTNFINETLQTLSTLAPWPEYTKTNGKVSCAATSKAFASISTSTGTVTVVFATAHSFIVGDVVDIVGLNTDWSETDQVITAVASLSISYVSSASSTTTTGTVTKHIDNTGLTNTNIWKVGAVIRTDRSAPLDELDADEYLEMKVYHAASGQPNYYCLQRDTSGSTILTRILIYPEPSSTLTLYYTYYVYPRVLSADGDLTDWPDTRLHLLTQAIKYRLAAQDRDASGAALYSAEFIAMVKKAYGYSRPSNRPFIANSSSYNETQTSLRNCEKTFVV